MLALLAMVALAGHGQGEEGSLQISLFVLCGTPVGETFSLLMCFYSVVFDWCLSFSRVFVTEIVLKQQLGSGMRCIWWISLCTWRLVRAFAVFNCKALDSFVFSY